MRALKYLRLSCPVSVFLIITLTFVIAVSAGAESTIVRTYIGYTKIHLEQNFVDDLIEANIEPSGIRPGYLDLKRKVIILPIVGGLADTEYLDLELYHTGGLQFNGANGNSTNIYNFLISNLLLQDSPVPGPGPGPGPGPFFEFDLPPGMPPMDQLLPTTITGLVVFDGGMIEARDAFSSIFDVNLNQADVDVKHSSLIISNIPVQMGDQLAVILNGLVDKDQEPPPPFFEPDPEVSIGTAVIYARFYSNWKYKFNHRSWRH